MNVILSFDVEDFVTPQADDALLTWAGILSDLALTGGFALVGERLRSLWRRGRTDVIDAIAGHEIGYHSNYHSLHPTYPVAADGLAWDAAVRWVVERDRSGIEDIRETFGRGSFFYVVPGNSWTPHVSAAMGRLGVRVLGDLPLAPPFKRCCALGMLSLRYAMSFEQYYGASSAGQMREAMLRDIGKLSEECDGEGYIVLYSHPMMAVTEEYWDTPLAGGGAAPREELKPAKLRPRGRAEEIFRFVRSFLEELSSRGDIQMTSYGRLLEEFDASRVKEVRFEEVLDMAAAILGKFDYVGAGGRSFAPSEVFGLLVAAAQIRRTSGRFPKDLPVRSLIHPVDMSERELADRRRCVKAPLAACLESAAALAEEIDDGRTIPKSIVVGGAEMTAAQYLMALACALLEESGREARPPESVGALPDAAEGAFSEFKYNGTWLFAPEFRGENVLREVRASSWTYKVL